MPSKLVWRKNFDIKRADYNIMVETMPGFGGLNYLTVGKNIITKVILVNENSDLTGAYFDKRELRQIAKLTLKTIIENPKRIWKVHKIATNLNKQYFKFAEKIRNVNFSNLSDSNLLSLHKKLFNLQYFSHCTAVTTTWWVDSDNEDLSKHLQSLIKSKLEKANLNVDSAQAFSILTSPKKESYATIEEKESLKILTLLKANSRAKRLFKTLSTEQIIQNLNKLPSKLRAKIIKHHYRWCWTPYTYMGPAYGLDYYLEIWRGLIKENLHVSSVLNKKQKLVQETQTKRQQLIKQLKFSKQEKEQFNIGADIVWLKGFRKDCYFHGFYVMDLLLAEIARRSGLSLKQAKFLLPKDLPMVLRGKDMSETANARIKLTVLYGNYTAKVYKIAKKQWTDKGFKLLTGIEAKKFLKSQKFERIKVEKTNYLTGTCACPGKASGVVKIVNLPEEMDKMNEDDIMLAHTTFPSLVPAMKKAAAIVTEDGGITCHAAIVAREMQIPCIVGIKNVTRIFKDRDLVEVDANKGIVKKIK